LKIDQISGFAVISPNPDKSASLYRDKLGLPFQLKNDYLYVDKMPGCNHFGIWPLAHAAQSCFGTDTWPETIPVPTSTIEYELESPEAVEEAVKELKAQGQDFVHDPIQEPWGQITARFMSPENVLIGLSYAPWLHQ